MPAERTRAVVAAAGGVVWRPADGGGVETVVVHRPRYDDWSLPKGKLDAGENALAAAVREVCEETGLQVVAGRRSVRTHYEVAVGPKHVDYWLMQAVDAGAFEPNDEVDELRWLSVADAAALVTHPHDRAVLTDLDRDDVPRAPSLLLVRHAKAGSRREWDGPDEERPLDAQGRRQAQQLAAVLPVFGPLELFSAERVRCRQTLEPLAQRLGLEVRPLPELGEEEYSADPQAGLAALERLLEPPPTPGVRVVCSQGGAIPAALAGLGVRFGGTRVAPPAAKGSVWVLGGRPGQLSADYYRDLGPDPDAP
ncbi:8-oxo-dGTP diphosphatase [Geodermatophilus saharensis]|uniref:8-oxo-dGTP diphosphatase n=1 Tax=Geodermatophilus saharensis TaxID=1137994 RepID=A0A239AE88_9ACTN|nr:NUDIX hydrolase [Geodermatophilus saharensis]SNR93889.1 8-oxo-dGTP diphosphatase [Geodermatophilus saharensis]